MIIFKELTFKNFLAVGNPVKINLNNKNNTKIN